MKAKKGYLHPRQYFCLFRIRFLSGIQYRAAALAGISTQFAWGLFSVMLYAAFYRSNPASFPMELSQVSSYIWLRQAFLALFNMWRFDSGIFDSIVKGNTAYELVRPTDVYSMWYVKNLSSRLADVLLRFAPIIIISAFIPSPFGLSAPENFTAFVWFLITMVLGALVACAMIMIVYALTFFTLQPQGVRMIFMAVADLLCGDLIPLPFFPDKIAGMLEYTPFAAVSNVPFRVYSGSISGMAIYEHAALQLFWFIALVAAGRMMMKISLKRAVVQGG